MTGPKNLYAHVFNAPMNNEHKSERIPPNRLREIVRISSMRGGGGGGGRGGYEMFTINEFPC